MRRWLPRTLPRGGCMPTSFTTWSGTCAILAVTLEHQHMTGIMLHAGIDCYVRVVAIFVMSMRCHNKDHGTRQGGRLVRHERDGRRKRLRLVGMEAVRA